MVACSWCGTVVEADQPPLGWTLSVEDGKQRWYCERCARENLRSIEGKLDSGAW